MNKSFLKEETKRSTLIRFLIILIIFIIYFLIIALKYGIEQGILITLLTWSFFVFCTPIADAGFLLDFPVRLLTKIRMIYSEIAVWTIAAAVNVYASISNPKIYESIFLLKVFKQILIHPFPYWSIIILSAIGTFLSVYFGDELIDVATHSERKKFKRHKKKHRIIILFFIIITTILLYYILVKHLGINLLKI